MYLALKDTGHQVQLLSTGQHRELLAGMNEIFGLHNVESLNAIIPGSSVLETQISIQSHLSNYLNVHHFDLVLVHGDTSTTLGGSLAAFAHKIPLAHIEAGLRSFDLTSPWPEEGIRRIVDQVSTLRFAPTEIAYQNLVSEGLQFNSFITGNTITDAIRIIFDKMKNSDFSEIYLGSVAAITSAKDYILVTQHRRESFDGGFHSVLSAIVSLAKQGLPVVWPIHPNPKVMEFLSPHISKYPNLSLIDPQPYPAMLKLISEAKVVISDSGGIQEEAPTLGVPLLITREKTERPEALGNSNSVLVGYSENEIYEKAISYYFEPYSETLQIKGKTLFGDGYASEKIVEIIESDFGSNNLKLI